jgi:membrane protein DedA with SNARE-associated domain
MFIAVIITGFALDFILDFIPSLNNTMLDWIVTGIVQAAILLGVYNFIKKRQRL